MTCCPHCNSEFSTDTLAAYGNIDSYHSPVVAKAKCCGRAVRMVPVTSVRLEFSAARKDDWGNPCHPSDAGADLTNSTET